MACLVSMTITAVLPVGETAAWSMFVTVAGTFRIRPERSGTIRTALPETAKLASFGGRFSAFSSRRTKASACLPPIVTCCEPPLGSRNIEATCHRGMR